MTNNKHKIFNILLLLLPIIDCLTSLSTRYLNLSFSIGSLSKGIILLYFIIYTLFLTKSKYKKAGTICIIFSSLYTILYFYSKSELLTKEFFFTEVIQLSKMLFFPIMFFAFLCFYEDSGFNKKKMNKILLIDLGLYLLFLIIPFVTGTSANTYIDGSLGHIGWFYSGNEISAILVLIFPFLYTLIQKDKILFIILLIISTIIISTIGTKVSMIGLIIIGIIIASKNLFTYKKTGIKTMICSVIALLIILIVMTNGIASKNMNLIIKNPREEEISEITSEIKEKTKNSQLLNIAIKLFSSRDIYLLDTTQIYINNYSISTLLLGLGFSNTEKIDDTRIQKLIEIDILDAFFHTGIFGLTLLLTPYITSLLLFIKSIKKKQTKFNSNTLFFGLIILMSGGISCMSGHVLLAPSVSIFILIYMMYFINEIGGFNKKTIDKNKVDILSLHLGYGGAERATIDLANILSEKYDVEIITLYKTIDNPPYLIDSKVKIKYLTNRKPNKEEFVYAIKHLRLFKIFSEGLKSLYILFLKKNLIKKHVEYSDARYIISSRIYFTKILNNYGRKDTKKISIEHNYDVSKKYIKILQKNCSLIDTLVTVSNESYKTYREHFPPKKLKYIPNMVSNEYNCLSSLTQTNLVYIGRLEPEKGTLDLIKLMKILCDQNAKIKMNIFGDGSLRNEMATLIEKYELQDNIILHGFQPAQTIGKYLKNSSLFVLTSHKESFGIVLLEAFSCGIPAIAFREATGATEIIKNDQNGYLINTRDLKLMAKKIIEFFDTKPREKQEMQKQALKTAKNYSYSNIKKIWFKLLKNLEDT